MILMASMLLFATSASAVELGGQKAKVMQMTTMSKADTQALFGKQAVQVNAVKLDKGEMAKTSGKWAWNTFSGLANGSFAALGYTVRHPYDSTLSGIGKAFLGGFAAGFVAPSITYRSAASYFAGGYFGS